MPAQDPRFNPEIDRRTGLPHAEHARGARGQQGGAAHRRHAGAEQARRTVSPRKDESRLRAFTAQIAIALENAKLFDDVLRVQNYNEASCARRATP